MTFQATRLRIESFHYDGLGNSAYLLVDEARGVAAVVDPQRDVDQYVEAAARLGARVTHVFETHVHNDFVSGGRALAEHHGAQLIVSNAAGLAYSHRPVRPGEVLAFGASHLRVLATPGHTPEHVSYLLEEDGRPSTLFSGGALMVGTIARTDLLGHEHAPGLARHAHHSLHHVLFPQPDETRVLPTHGAGSFCAGGASDERETTIGDEKRRNRFAPLVEPDEFVQAALAGLPRYPTYFDRMRGLNQSGAPVLKALPELPSLQPGEVKRHLEAGAVLVDTRPPATYDAQHVRGSLSVAREPSFSQWVGWLVPPDRPLLFVMDSQNVGERIVRELIRIGYDNLEGYLAGGVAAWRTAGHPTASVPLITADQLAQLRQGGTPPTVLDVRWDDEWAAGHIPGALHIAVPDLQAGSLQGPSDHAVAVHCAHSFRSGIAISLLERAGWSGPILHLDGGIEAWHAAGQAIEASECAAVTA